ncbi:hypothetical protein P4S64_06330 [Vibrio sp. M60_M31a]
MLDGFFQGLMMALSLFITALSLFFLFSAPEQGVSYSQIMVNFTGKLKTI